jgi:hypothetical protein
MLTHEELRRRLRDADRADERAMSEADRIHLRAMLVGRAARARVRPRLAPVFALATAAAAVVTILVLKSPVETTPSVALEASPATRIYFTGPEGTKIQWFVTNPEPKELGS